MDTLMAGIQALKTFVLRLTELGFVMVGFIVLVYLLLGENSGDFVISVIANLSILVDILTPNVLIGLALVLFMGVLWRQRR
ncbi:MAG: hypothetical protein ACT4N9_10260 [Paracoccaceae bacterium]